MGIKTGDKYKIYLDTADNWGSPTWVELTEIGDIDFDDSHEMVEPDRRVGYKSAIPGDIEYAFTFDHNIDPSDSNSALILTAVRDGSALHLAVADGPIATTGTNYTEAHWLIKGPQSYSKGSTASMSCECMPDACAPSGEDPRYVTVA